MENREDFVRNQTERISRLGGGRVFYGWILVAVVWLIYMFTTALPLYGGSVLNSLVVLKAGVSEEKLGLATTVHTAMSGALSPVVGYVVKRRGSRVAFIVGSLFTLSAAVGFILLPAGGVQLVLCYGVLAALGISIGGTLTTQSILIRWFDQNQAVALSLALTSGAVGGFIGPVIMNALSGSGDWRPGWGLVGAGAVAALLMALFLVKDKPADIGEIPDGHAYAARNARRRKEDGETSASALPSMTLGEALRTKEFYISTGTSIFRLALHYSVLGYVVVYAAGSGIPSGQAALLVSAISITSLAGRLMVGVLHKAGVPVKALLFLSSMSMAACGLLLFFGKGFLCFVLGSMCAGLGFGISMVNGSMYLTHYFGPEHFSVIYGALSPVSTVVASCGPAITGAVAATGGYGGPFLVMGLANAAMAVPCLFSSMPRKRRGGQ